MLRIASLSDSAPVVRPLFQQIYLPVYDRYHKEVAASDIVMIEGDGNYAIFYFSSGKKLMVSKTLKEYETLLGNHHFVRVHKSYMINLHYLERFDVKYEDTVWLRTGLRVDVSRRRKKEFHAKALDFMGRLAS
jgi:two-component system LytT family response regulator